MTVVTVVGAGVAGIKAAVDLTRAGIKVIVLEARDQLGGRIRAFRKNNLHCELGMALRSIFRRTN
jgi:monoamine oxidase